MFPSQSRSVNTPKHQPPSPLEGWILLLSSLSLSLALFPALPLSLSCQLCPSLFLFLSLFLFFSPLSLSSLLFKPFTSCLASPVEIQLGQPLYLFSVFPFAPLHSEPTGSIIPPFFQSVTPNRTQLWDHRTVLTGSSRLCLQSRPAGR